MSAKIKRSLIILLIVLVIIIAAAAAAILIPKAKNDDAAASGSIITVTNPVKVSFGSNEPVEYILEGDLWYYSEDTTYPIKQNGITRIINALPKLIPTRTIEASDELSAYGLSPADYTVILTDAEGNTQTLYLGSAAGDSGSYAMVDGDSTIYIIPQNTNIVSFAASTLYSMIDADLPPSMGESAVLEMTVSYGGKSVSVKQKDESWYYLTESGEYVVEEDFSAVGSDGESHTVRKYMNDVGNAISDFKSRSCRGYNCTPEQLSEYGFDNPLIVTVLKTDGTTLTYRVGGTLTDSAGTEYNYFTVDGNPALLCMDSSAIPPFIELVNVLGR